MARDAHDLRRAPGLLDRDVADEIGQFLALVVVHAAQASSDGLRVLDGNGGCQPARSAEGVGEQVLLGRVVVDVDAGAVIVGTPEVEEGVPAGRR